MVDALIRSGFDVEAYINSYDDLKQALKTPESGYLTCVRHASEETRWFPIELKVDGLARIAELPAPSRDKARIITALLRSYLVPWSSLWVKSDSEFAAFWAELIEVLSERFHPYFIIGDSHTQIHTRIFAYREKFTIPFQIVCLATSARGLISPTSRSGSGARVAKLASVIQDLRQKTPVFLKFGQVDVEFVFDFHRIKDKEHAFVVEKWQAFTAESIDRYLEFISHRFHSRPTFLLGIFPPALSDEALSRGYVNDHIVETEGVSSIEETKAFVTSLKYPDKQSRTALHRDFNARLFDAARSAGFDCIDDFDALMGAGGVIAPCFTPNEDHHLGYEATRSVAQSTLQIGFDRLAESAGAERRDEKVSL